MFRVIFLLIALGPLEDLPAGGPGPNSSAVFRSDNVQAIMRELAQTDPQLVAYIPETGRWYLKRPRPEAVSESLLMRLHDAFYKDFVVLCKQYGRKYLLNWRVLLSKAARETFWGTSYLSNRANNYFGIRLKNKPWICDSFGFCQAISRQDPDYAEFVIFPDVESSLWMFIHTMYSPHYLERLPDLGVRVERAISFERTAGTHYWVPTPYGLELTEQLRGDRYTVEEIIYTWSQHPKNNLCVECSRQSDLDWVERVRRADRRAIN